MSLDLKGIHQFTEGDTSPTFSELLNKGMASVSAAKAYFAGTAVKRAALEPAPAGAMWQDTDGTQRLHSPAPDGSWRQHEGVGVMPAGGWESSTAPIYSRVLNVTIPTILGPNETLEIMIGPLGAYGFVSLGLVTRNVGNTVIQVRFTQFSSATARNPEFTWRVVRG